MAVRDTPGRGFAVKAAVRLLIVPKLYQD
jgi:hypothetical protein